MNKQKILTTFILLLIFIHTKGQDKIVTTQKDTIFCKIVSISPKLIKYEQATYNQRPVSKSIPMKQVRDYSLGVRSPKSSPDPSTKEQITEPVSKPLIEEQVTEFFSEPLIKEQVTESLSEPLIEEQVTESLSEPLIQEQVTEPLSEPLIQEQVIKSLSEPLIQEQVTEPFSEPPIQEQVIKSLSEPSAKEHVTDSFSYPSLKEQVEKLFPTFSTEKQSAERSQRWRIGIHSGGSYLVNSLAGLRQAMKDSGVSLPHQADNYYKKLRMGISADLDIYFLATHSWGMGLRYSLFASSVQMDYSVRDTDSEIPLYHSVNEKEKLFLNYVGPSVLFRQWLDENHKFRLNEELSFGFIGFRSEKQFDPYQYVFVNPETNKKQYNVLNEGNAFCGNFQLSVEYYPSSWLSIGANAGIFYPAIFRTLKVSDHNRSIEKDLDEKDYLNLSRLDFSIGVCFHF